MKSRDMATKNKKTYTELGYSRLDTAEIVTFLNRLLSDLVVFQQKVRNFGWNISGRDFISIHTMFTEMNTRITIEIDKVAERIKLFGEKPVSNYTAIQEIANVSNLDLEDDTAYEMVQITLEDIRKIIDCMDQTIQVSQEIKDYGTEYLIKSMVYDLEKEHWIFTEWLKNTY